MKKSLLISIIALTMGLSAFAGGILTNTNQSAKYIRLLANDATLDIDAVYFNPAGLTFLDDGFHISLNSQSIFQNQEVINSYSFLNHSSYVGEISAPVFPGVYAAYKTGKLAFSVGFNPIGGGGGAEFAEGLPSFETGISQLPAMLGDDFNAYNGDFYFTGTSVFWGLQFGVSYQTCDYFSLYLGGRYLMAKNTYEGYIKDVNVYNVPAGAFLPASDVISGAAANFGTAATQMQALVDGGLGTLTPTEALAAQYITQEQFDGLNDAYTALGLPSTTDLSTGQATAAGASAQYGAQASLLEDQEADAKETGTGFAPIFGANLNLLDKKLNIGIKYEMKTELELENSTKMDFTVGFDDSGNPITMFPDGAKKRQDLPAMLSIGASYKVGEKLTVHAGYHQFWDQDADWNGRDSLLSGNSNEMAIGFEYQVAENLLLSLGYLHTTTGASSEYQTDMSFSLNSNTIGFGGKFKVQDNFYINMGIGYTTYVTAENYHDYDLGTHVKETYGKDNLFLAIGADIKLF